MRLYQQFRASIARSAVAGAGVLLFASGMPVSAFGQTPQAQPTAAATPARPARQASQPASVANGTPLSIEDAVRMALENNLGIQSREAEPADPGARRSRAPARRTRRRS